MSLEMRADPVTVSRLVALFQVKSASPPNEPPSLNWTCVLAPPGVVVATEELTKTHPLFTVGIGCYPTCAMSEPDQLEPDGESCLLKSI